MQIHQVTNPVHLPADPTLYGIVDDLIQDTAALAILHKNYIINNIPDDLRLQANGMIISSVLSKLFDTALRHAKNSVILISAKLYGMVVLVQVKSKGNISPALPEDIGHACLKAQKTGGIVEMINCESEQASIAYCFLNVTGVA